MKSILKIIVVSILTWEAKLVLKKYKPKVVAVTGSVGKTSTKDTIATVLSHFFYIRKSEKSFNSELGVPLTVLGCPNGWGSAVLWLKNIFEGLALIVLPNHYPDLLVLEVGADRPGDIESLTQWVRPDIAVITRLSKVPVHVEFFSSPAQVFEEKGRLAEAVKRDGTLVLNADDEDVLAFRTLTENISLLYGLANNSDVLGTAYEIMYEGGGKTRRPVGVMFKVNIQNEEIAVSMKGSLGLQVVYPVLAAFAVGSALGLSSKKMLQALSAHTPSSGRMRLIPGIKETTIIDDTYNSSPVALHEALNTLDHIDAVHKKIAVLGDMLELGVYSADEHKRAGKHVAEVADILITVGVRARGIAEGALDGKMSEKKIFQFESSREAGKYLQTILKAGDVVLVKGSQGVRMERTVEEILADPLLKEKLLVRQDAEWMNR